MPYGPEMTNKEKRRERGKKNRERKDAVRIRS